MSAPVLSTNNLCVALGGAPILRQVSLELPAGCWFGLLGINGSGKTTLLRTLAGRLRPASGAVSLAGHAGAASPAQLAVRVGFAPPVETLPGELTAGELIALMNQARGAAGSSAPHQGVAAALGIDGLRHTLIATMSAGQRQRVALMLAFVGMPAVVLLDEPFNWLDPVAAYDVKAALQGLVQNGLCLVTSLHDVATFATRCDRGALLHDGAVARDFSAADMLAARGDIAGLEAGIYQALRRKQGVLF